MRSLQSFELDSDCVPLVDLLAYTAFQQPLTGAVSFTARAPALQGELGFSGLSCSVLAPSYGEFGVTLRPGLLRKAGAESFRDPEKCLSSLENGKHGPLINRSHTLHAAVGIPQPEVGAFCDSGVTIPRPAKTGLAQAGAHAACRQHGAVLQLQPGHGAAAPGAPGAPRAAALRGLRRVDGPSRAKSASHSLRRALLTPQVNPGSLYRCGKRT